MKGVEVVGDCNSGNDELGDLAAGGVWMPRDSVVGCQCVDR